MQKLLTNQNNHLFVVSAPAGTGKNTLVNKLLQEFDSIVESVSYTTRKPREDEVEGKDYFFVSEKEFQEKIQKDEFLEYAKVFDHYYGTSKTFVSKKIKENKHVVLVIDTQGAMAIKKEKIASVFIFIAPPSKEEQLNRLKRRKTENAKELQMRLDWSQKEMQMVKNYDYLVINEDLDIAYQVLKSIFIAEDHHVKNN